MYSKFKMFITNIKYFFLHEIKYIFTDAGAILIFMLALIIYPLLYAVAYQNEVVKEIPVSMVDLNHTKTSRNICRLIDATEQIDIVNISSSLKEAEKLFYEGDIKGIILIENNFEKNILSGKSGNIIVYSDASYFLLYKQMYSACVASINQFKSDIEIKRMLTEGIMLKNAIKNQEPLKLNTHYLYNPSGGYGSFVIPAIVLLILQQTLLIGIGMLQGTFNEKKLYKNLLEFSDYTKNGVSLIIGKTMAYLAIYFFNILFVSGVLHKWYNFPENSSLYNTLLIFLPFLTSVSFMGIAIGFLFKERIHSLLFIVFLSPIALFISGLSWPGQSLPQFIKLISYIFPSTSMIPAYIKLRIQGASLYCIKKEYIQMLIQMFIYFILACISYNYTYRSKK